ncbi:MAG TPA: VTC domain-containing protein, partial [Chitinophagales bacterium]|nr:VTC domain-containing protein [Chitinophagales bacterium]
MSSIEGILRDYQGISLSELDKIDLSDRKDYKSVFPDSLLPRFLEQLLPRYRVLDMNGRRTFQYESVYFDTPDLQSYQDHQRGKARRNKFRFRRYVDCGDSYFEIKTRNGKGRNLKTRIPANGSFMQLSSAIKQKIRERTHV